MAPNSDDKEYLQMRSQDMNDEEPFQNLAQAGTKMA